ncbi:MAG: ATP-binding protein [Bacteroidota bacterium]
MEITSRPELTHAQLLELEMHSFLNIMNVLGAQIQLIQEDLQRPEILDLPLQEVQDLARDMVKGDRTRLSPKRFYGFKGLLETALFELEQKNSDLMDDPYYQEYREVFDQILQVLETRIVEWSFRWTEPNAWYRFSKDEFAREIQHFLGAIEKNSRGRYRIVYNIARQEKNDYLVHVTIDSDQESCLLMPLMLKDSIRDLIANARKYTPPGGKIDIGITQKKNSLRFVIEDTGRGIPPDEIEKVVLYGYRSSNVLDEVRTMGNGVGLTKAHWIADLLGGRLSVESDGRSGTVIEFEIPTPALSDVLERGPSQVMSGDN